MWLMADNEWCLLNNESVLWWFCQVYDQGTSFSFPNYDYYSFSLKAATAKLEAYLSLIYFFPYDLEA